MVESGNNQGEDPICQPRLIRLLRKRPKLFNIEVRDRFLESMEITMCERRKPENVADRLSGTMGEAVRSAGQPVARDEARKRMKKANRTVFKRL